MIRTKRSQFRKTMMGTNRIIPSKNAEINTPSIIPPPDMVMQFKNDDGKQVKIMNGKGVLKTPEKQTDLIAAKPKEKDEKVYLPGQRFLEKLNKYKKKSKVTFDD
jgi:hypothetical protein